MNLSEKVGLKIRKFRLEKGLSQEELAYKTGLQQSQIYRIETGKRRFNSDQLEKISQALGIPAIKFFEEALEIFENKNFEKQSADILHKLGDIYINKGTIDLAISNFERAKFYYREIQDEYNTNLLTEKLNSLIASNDLNL